MDVVLNIVDANFFTPYVYPSWLEEGNLVRQLISLNILVDAGGAFLYLFLASLSYYFIFDKELLAHPQMLEVRYLKHTIHTAHS